MWLTQLCLLSAGAADNGASDSDEYIADSSDTDDNDCQSDEDEDDEYAVSKPPPPKKKRATKAASADKTNKGRGLSSDSSSLLCVASVC